MKNLIIGNRKIERFSNLSSSEQKHSKKQFDNREKAIINNINNHNLSNAIKIALEQNENKKIILSKDLRNALSQILVRYYRSNAILQMKPEERTIENLEKIAIPKGVWSKYSISNNPLSSNEQSIASNFLRAIHQSGARGESEIISELQKMYPIKTNVAKRSIRNFQKNIQTPKQEPVEEISEQDELNISALETETETEKKFLGMPKKTGVIIIATLILGFGFIFTRKYHKLF